MWLQCQSFDLNTLGLRQNGHHFADSVFKYIFLNKNVWVLLNISLKFVCKVPTNNIPALVWMMAWRRSGYKPLSEPMMVGFRCIYASPGLNGLKHFLMMLIPWPFPVNFHSRIRQQWQNLINDWFTSFTYYIIMQCKKRKRKSKKTLFKVGAVKKQ